MTEPEDVERYWRALVKAVRAFMSDYRLSLLPDVKNERTFQACLFYEFIRIGGDLRDISLEPSNFKVEPNTRHKPDVVLRGGLIVCELKSNLKIRPMRDDMKLLDKYRIGVFISNGSSTLDKTHYPDYETAIENDFGYKPMNVEDWEVPELQYGKSYWHWEYGRSGLEHRLYMALNVSRPLTS